MTGSHSVTPTLPPSLRREFAKRRERLLASLPTSSDPLSIPPPALASGPDDTPTPPPAEDDSRYEKLGLSLGRENARLFDQLLDSIFEATAIPPEEWGVAVAGVGGYGRGAVALRSDLDLRIVGTDLSQAAEITDALLYPLWDAGISLGHQVVCIEEVVEAARSDLPSATSLLDWRHLAGDRELSESLHRRAAAGVFAPSELPRFMERLQEEVAERHGRFGGSVYLLEPDVKNGAGGLRDLDIALWAAKARYGVSELSDLIRLGVLVLREAEELGEAGEMLWRIRNLLHAHAGRRSDRLTFDEQESIAALLGYGEGGDAVEHMMSAYYVAARTISRGKDTVLARVTPVFHRRRPKAEPIAPGVALFDGCATFSDDASLEQDPELALRLVESAVGKSVPLLPYARAAIVRASSNAAWCARLRDSPGAAARFVSLCTDGRETALLRGTVMRELHDVGLLLAMIPEFSPVVGRVHHDVYHVYTVDVHSVAAVDRLAALRRGDLADEYGLASQIAAQLARPEVLFLATLLHDVGKAIGGRDHSARGAEMAAGILKRLGLSSRDTSDACELIREHLTMYRIATRRDLDDPTTVAELSARVRGREGLRHLFLLTVADISTTSPTSMTSWKATMLDQLFLATDASLSGTRGEDLAAEYEDALAEVESMPATSEEERVKRRDFVREYLDSMPDRYLLSNPGTAIASHAEVARRHDDRPISVALVPSRHPDVAELCVVAKDRPGLLASIAAALAGARLEVLGAQVHSRLRPDGSVQAVDLFWVRDRTEGADGVAPALPKVIRELHEIVEEGLDPSEVLPPLPRRDRASPRVPTRITLENRASPEHTVIEVITRDRPGLLYAIADALYRLGLAIAVAKINTEGTKVADVFYVSEADGSKIELGHKGARGAEVERGIRAALEGLETGGNA